MVAQVNSAGVAGRWGTGSRAGKKRIGIERRRSRIFIMGVCVPDIYESYLDTRES